MDQTRRTYESPRGVAPYESRELRGGEAYVIEKYFTGKRVLDIGCGSGRTTGHIAKVAREVIGIDYSAAMVARAKELEPTLSFKHMDVRSMDLPSASFDAAFFSFNGLDYLYPLTGREQAFREIRRVLRPSGTLSYASHISRPRLRMSARIVLGRLYALVFGYRPPYYARLTPGGFLVTCHLPEEFQKNMLAKEGFSVLEVVPTKNGEAIFVAQKV